MASLTEIWNRVSQSAEPQAVEQDKVAGTTEEEVVTYWNSLSEDDRAKYASAVAEEMETEENMAKFAEAYSLGESMAMGLIEELQGEAK